MIAGRFYTYPQASGVFDAHSMLEIRTEQPCSVAWLVNYRILVAIWTKMFAMIMSWTHHGDRAGSFSLASYLIFRDFLKNVLLLQFLYKSVFLRTSLPWVLVSSVVLFIKNPALRRTYSVDGLFVLLWDRDNPWHIFREAPGPSGWTATLGRSRSGVGLVDQPDEVVLVGLDKFQKLWKWESQSFTRLTQVVF